ncbi:MAG: recombinase family protein [Solirubrobacteraceae bacterium]
MTENRTPAGTKRAAAYVRVSTERQAKEGLSLDEQQRRVEAHIAAQGWTLVRTYVEAGVSGAVPFADRPELSLLMASLDGIDRVVIPKLDRLGRSTKALLDAFDVFEQAGVGVVSLAESIDTATPVGKLTRTLLAAIAEFERDRLKERVTEVVDVRARQGVHHGGPQPYGYDYIRNEKGESTKDGLVIIEAQAVIIRRIFGDFIAGKTQRQIARELNDDGITTQRGGRWYQGTISTLLKNPIYSGRVRTNGKVYDGLHDTIVEADTWAKACQLHSGPKGSKRTTANHLLAGGLLKCGRCGSAMLAVTKPTRTEGVLYERYRCSLRADEGVEACGMPPVRRDVIDGAIWSFFEKVALDVDSTRAALAAQHDGKTAEIDALRDQADREAQKTADALVRVEGDYLDGRISPEQWHRLERKLTDQLQAARAQTDRLEQQQQAIEQEREAFDVETVLLEELSQLRAAVVGEAQASGSVDALRATLRRLFTFELLDAARPFGAGLKDDHDRVAWPHRDLSIESAGLVLLPHVRTDAITAWWDAETEFPALRRAALSLRASNGNPLQT